MCYDVTAMLLIYCNVTCYNVVLIREVNQSTVTDVLFRGLLLLSAELMYEYLPICATCLS